MYKLDADSSDEAVELLLAVGDTHWKSVLCGLAFKGISLLFLFLGAELPYIWLARLCTKVWAAGSNNFSAVSHKNALWWISGTSLASFSKSESWISFSASSFRKSCRLSRPFVNNFIISSAFTNRLWCNVFGGPVFAFCHSPCLSFLFDNLFRITILLASHSPTFYLVAMCLLPSM